jgi:TonB-dependent SusC/RagA subfamily outer membrane receptor
MTPSNLPDRLLPALALALLAGCAPSQTSGTGSAPAPQSGVAVTAEQVQQTPGDPIEKLLMNRSPGVWVGRSSDGNLAVRIRGGSSLMANAEPLYIVDGSPFMPGPNGTLTGLNPYDVESIKVLKDPAELSMYGVRGANGVIIIKTKQRNRD